MAYRSDLKALLMRRAAVSAELEGVLAQSRSVADMRWAHEREIHALDAAIALHRRRGVPVVEELRVASPCNARWEAMAGDERVRFCSQCSKNVYNLFALSRAEVEALVGDEKEACVRMFQRADGSVITNDCPVGARKRRVRRFAAFGAAAVVTVTALAGVVTSSGHVPVVPLDALVEHPERFRGSPMRTEGTLVHGTLTTLKAPCEYRFTLAMGHARLAVRYNECVAPDNFRDTPARALPVAVEGELRADGSFEATALFTMVASGSLYQPQSDVTDRP